MLLVKTGGCYCECEAKLPAGAICMDDLVVGAHLEVVTSYLKLSQRPLYHR